MDLKTAAAIAVLGRLHSRLLHRKWLAILFFMTFTWWLMMALASFLASRNDEAAAMHVERWLLRSPP